MEAGGIESLAQGFSEFINAKLKATNQRIKANVAQLLDYFKDFDKVIKLTDRQKAEIVGHKRDEKTGEIIKPSEAEPVLDPSTPEDHEAAANLVAAICAATRPTRSEAEGLETRNKMLRELKERLKEKGFIKKDE